jgi:hypothetical protein
MTAFLSVHNLDATSLVQADVLTATRSMIEQKSCGIQTKRKVGGECGLYHLVSGLGMKESSPQSHRSIVPLIWAAFMSSHEQ